MSSLSGLDFTISSDAWHPRAAWFLRTLYGYIRSMQQSARSGHRAHISRLKFTSTIEHYSSVYNDLFQWRAGGRGLQSAQLRLVITMSFQARASKFQARLAFRKAVPFAIVFVIGVLGILMVDEGRPLASNRSFVRANRDYPVLGWGRRGHLLRRVGARHGLAGT